MSNYMQEYHDLTNMLVCAGPEYHAAICTGEFPDETEALTGCTDSPGPSGPDAQCSGYCTAGVQCTKLSRLFGHDTNPAFSSHVLNTGGVSDNLKPASWRACRLGWGGLAAAFLRQHRGARGGPRRDRAHYRRRGQAGPTADA
jgi:hypothetical protein